MNHNIAIISIIVLILLIIPALILINHTIQLTIKRINLIEKSHISTDDIRGKQINLLIEINKTQDKRIDTATTFMSDKIVPVLYKSNTDICQSLEVLTVHSRYVIQYLMQSPEFKEWISDKIKDLDNNLDVDLDINTIITDIERKHNLNDGELDA